MGDYINLFIPSFNKKNIIIGFLASIAFITLNLISGISIGIPTQIGGFSLFEISSIIAKIGIVIILASIIEQILFDGLILGILDFYLHPVFAVTIKSILFTITHYVAYGSSLSAQNANFIGAFIFGNITGILTLLGFFGATFIMHSIINGYILLTQFKEQFVILQI